uniref:Peptidase C14 caspase domain-containing protein n=1 Tax=Oxyrrhis marina TaxID=2969 RepID=A0A7S4GQ04_OXYMA
MAHHGAHTADGRGPTKAVVVGCNYTSFPEARRLHGCVNDALFHFQFAKAAGFPPEHIKVLTDPVNHNDPNIPKAHLPTKHHLTSALQWLVDGARPGDVLYLFFAGYGSQVKDTRGAEIDGRRSCLVCSDHSPLDPSVIPADAIRAALAKAPAETSIFCVFDAGHCGTLLDLDVHVDSSKVCSLLVYEGGEKVYREATKRCSGDAWKDAQELKQHGASLATRCFPYVEFVGIKEGPQAQIAAHVLCLAASRDDQTAAEIIDHVPQGVLTSSILAAMQELGVQVFAESYGVFVERVSDTVAFTFMDQYPEITQMPQFGFTESIHPDDFGVLSCSWPHSEESGLTDRDVVDLGSPIEDDVAGPTKDFMQDLLLAYVATRRLIPYPVAQVIEFHVNRRKTAEEGTADAEVMLVSAALECEEQDGSMSRDFRWFECKRENSKWEIARLGPARSGLFSRCSLPDVLRAAPTTMGSSRVNRGPAGDARSTASKKTTRSARIAEGSGDLYACMDHLSRALLKDWEDVEMIGELYVILIETSQNMSEQSHMAVRKLLDSDAFWEPWRRHALMMRYCHWYKDVQRVAASNKEVESLFVNLAPPAEHAESAYKHRTRSPTDDAAQYEAHGAWYEVRAVKGKGIRSWDAYQSGEDQACSGAACAVAGCIPQ